MREFQFDSSQLPEYKPLESYGIIGGSRTAVMGSAVGSIDASCLPEFESACVFGVLLDSEAGRLPSLPFGCSTSWQRYERGTNVLTSEMATARGTMRIRDFMPYTRRKVPTAEIYRRVECLRGTVDFEVIFEPRFDYGLRLPKLQVGNYGVKAVDQE